MDSLRMCPVATHAAEVLALMRNGGFDWARLARRMIKSIRACIVCIKLGILSVF